MVGTGSVIVHDIKEFELVIRNSGIHNGWVGKAGFRLIYKSNKLCYFQKQVRYIQLMKVIK